MSREPLALVSSFPRRLAALQKRFPRVASDLAFTKPLAEDFVSTFERKFRITLPRDYRRFITTVGSGGGGIPWEGLFSIRHPLRKGLYSLADPFPEPTSASQNVMPMIGGVLPVGCDGSSSEIGLVVSGTAYGQLWVVVEERPGWVPLCRTPARKREESMAALLSDQNRPRRHSFATWFDERLENLEAGRLDYLPGS